MKRTLQKGECARTTHDSKNIFMLWFPPRNCTACNNFECTYLTHGHMCNMHLIGQRGARAGTEWAMSDAHKQHRHTNAASFQRPQSRARNKTVIVVSVQIRFINTIYCLLGTVLRRWILLINHFWYGKGPHVRNGLHFWTVCVYVLCTRTQILSFEYLSLNICRPSAAQWK